ncbi:hypothetical protein M5689_013274 [Euphorbia peplus]|nr:hypothetical protein M5689_013274 [Euphorbia peplus]
MVEVEGSLKEVRQENKDELGENVQPKRARKKQEANCINLKKPKISPTYPESFVAIEIMSADKDEDT